MTSGQSSTPLCRCRVWYIGSAVPTITKDGLQGIQEPLKQLYPTDSTPDKLMGIDSWLSVWSNGLLLEYVEENHKKTTETAFFPITSLHYCAAVRYVNVTGYSIEGGGERFLPLDSPFADLPDSKHPAIFSAMLRRTSGVKVLECHAFVCSNPKAANALVRCCFHAYADSMYMKSDDAIASLSEHNGASRHNAPSNTNGPILAIKGKESNSDGGSSVAGSARFGNVAEGGNEEEDNKEREILRWSDARAKHMWQNRQQGGEYDSYSLASSLAERYATAPVDQDKFQEFRSAKSKGKAPVDAQGRELMLYANQRGQEGTYKTQRRRAESERDFYHGQYPHHGESESVIDSRHRDFSPFPPPLLHPAQGGPPPMLMFDPSRTGASMHVPPPPGHNMVFAPGQPPPGFMIRPIPPPPQLMRPTLPPPEMVVRNGSTMRGAPEPHPMMMHSLPHLPPYPHPHLIHPIHGPIAPPSMPLMLHPMDHRGRMTMSPSPFVVQPESPEPPIYGTFRRDPQLQRAREEPIYLPASMPPPPPHMIPPAASYTPGAFPPDRYDAYYDTYLRPEQKKKKDKKAGKKQQPSSMLGLPRPEFANGGMGTYDAGIYRRPYINEKAFGNTLRRDPADSSPNLLIESHDSSPRSRQDYRYTNGRHSVSPAQLSPDGAVMKHSPGGRESELSDRMQDMAFHDQRALHVSKGRVYRPRERERELQSATMY